MQAFSEEHGLTFPILVDMEGKAAQAYRVRTIPATFVIDQNGLIVSRHVGPLGESAIARNWGQICG